MTVRVARATAQIGVAACVIALSACAQEGSADNEPAAAASTAQQGATAVVAQAAEDNEAALLERGDYLMNGIVACGNCHTPRDENGNLIEGMELAGAFVIEEPGFRAYAPNITPDVETGIGSWTDEQIIRAIREGVRPDGRVLGPPMGFPFYRGISDRDIRAIVAYLRNVPLVRNEVPRSTYRIPLPPNWGDPVVSVPEPNKDAPVEYGRYLTHNLGHCTDCHTPLV